MSSLDIAFGDEILFFHHFKAAVTFSSEFLSFWWEIYSFYLNSCFLLWNSHFFPNFVVIVYISFGQLSFDVAGYKFQVYPIWHWLSFMNLFEGVVVILGLPWWLLFAKCVSHVLHSSPSQIPIAQILNLLLLSYKLPRLLPPPPPNILLFFSWEYLVSLGLSSSLVTSLLWCQAHSAHFCYWTFQF